jgi:hypothetical protein
MIELVYACPNHWRQYEAEMHVTGGKTSTVQKSAICFFFPPFSFLKKNVLFNFPQLTEVHTRLELAP